MTEEKELQPVDIEWEAEKICRWGAARAGVIVVAPLVGTMALMANEVYMKLTLDNDTFENTGKSRFFERRTSRVLY